MASSSTPVRPGRYLSLFLVLLVGAYLLVFLTGDKKPEPKLGIDLQGAHMSQEVTFGAAGEEYEITCIVLCGAGHAEMKAKIVVQ